MPMSDSEAYRIGDELLEVLQPILKRDPSITVITSLGRIAMRLCEPLVLRGLREPNEAMVKAGAGELVWLLDSEGDREDYASSIIQAGLDTLLEQKGMKGE